MYKSADPLSDYRSHETATAEETSRVFLDQVICSYGVPQQVLTDRGTNFTSSLFNRLCKLLGTTHLSTTAFRPQANGHVERANRSIQEVIRKLAEKQEWDELLPRTSFALRTHCHESTGVSPFKALMDFEPRIPAPIKEIDNQTPLNELQNRAEEMVTKLVRTFSDTRTLMLKKLQKDYDKKGRR